MKNGQKQKYSIWAFIIGFLTNFVKNFILLFAGVVLLTAGIWIRECFSVGLVLLALDVFVSFLEQLRVRNAALAEKDISNWEKEAIASRWKKLVDEAIEGKGRYPEGDDTDKFSA